MADGDIINDNGASSFLASLGSSAANPYDTPAAAVAVAPASSYDPAAQRSYLANVGARFMDALSDNTRVGRLLIKPFYESDSDQFQRQQMARARQQWALQDQVQPLETQYKQLSLQNGVADQQFKAQTLAGDQANALKQQQLTSNILDNEQENLPQKNQLAQMQTQTAINDLSDREKNRATNNILIKYQQQNALNANYDKDNAELTNNLAQRLRGQEFGKIEQFANMPIPEQEQFMQSEAVQKLLKIQTAESLYYKFKKDPDQWGGQLNRFLQQNGLDMSDAAGGKNVLADMSGDSAYEVSYDNFAKIHNMVVQGAANELKARAMLTGAQSSVRGSDLSNLTTSLNPYIHSVKDQIQSVQQFYGTLQPEEINTHLLASGLKTALSDGRLTAQEKQMLVPQLQNLAQQGGFKVEMPADGNMMNCQIIYSDGTRRTIPDFADDLQKRDAVPDKWNDYVSGIAARSKEGMEYNAQRQAKIKFEQDKREAATAGFDVGAITNDPAQQKKLLNDHNNSLVAANWTYANSNGDAQLAQEAYIAGMKKDAGLKDNQIINIYSPENNKIDAINQQLKPLREKSRSLASLAVHGAPDIPSGAENAVELINAEDPLKYPGMSLSGKSSKRSEYYNNLDQIQKLSDERGVLMAKLAADAAKRQESAGGEQRRRTLVNIRKGSK